MNEDLMRDAQRVREYGAKHGFEFLTERKLDCDESEAWALTAVAVKVCDAQGAYRGPAGPTYVFMTFGEVTITNPKRQNREDP